ncbi:hypothetical protein PoB_001604800 [Plakobranchus ocellatus]|uniref:Uncharacterized protein n=1 Tax=Plakobranchus ocellatus TaxID=259542 RepID=A0AAV3Z515_9GAST|nr:hypothetical protein PoB_001604800 [Plakobranchus ocellatus]
MFLVDYMHLNTHYIVTSNEGPQQGDLRLSGHPLGRGAGSGARTRGRRVLADLRADSLATVPQASQPQRTKIIREARFLRGRLSPRCTEMERTFPQKSWRV